MTTIYDLIGVLVFSWFILIIPVAFTKLFLRTFNIR